MLVELFRGIGSLIVRWYNTSQVNTLFVWSSDLVDLILVFCGREMAWLQLGLCLNRHCKCGTACVVFQGPGGNSSNPCESGSMFLSSSSYRLHVVQCMNFNHVFCICPHLSTPVYSAKISNKIKASSMDLAMKEKIFKPKSDMVGAYRDKEKKFARRLNGVEMLQLKASGAKGRAKVLSD